LKPFTDFTTYTYSAQYLRCTAFALKGLREKIMGDLVAINLRSRVLRADRGLEDKIRECVEIFQKTGTYQSALNVCRAACPGCDVGFSQRLPEGQFRVEVRYDNLLHEGEGETEAAALMDAILHISDAIGAEQSTDGRVQN
jgi:hypothetical protein